MSAFRFLGFPETEGLESFCSHELENLMELAPSDAVSSAVIEKRGEWYLCRITLHSEATPFSSTVFSAEPQLAVKLCVEKTREKLDEWKRHRFDFPMESGLEPLCA